MVPWIPAFTGMTKKGGCQVFAVVPWIPDEVRDDKAG